MKALPDGSVDAVITDPQYGVGVKYDATEDTPSYVRWIVETCVPQMLRVSRRMAITPGVRNLFAYPEPTHTGSFSYPAGVGVTRWGFTCWQPILLYGSDPYGGKGSRPDSFTSYESAEDCGHPCPKPIGQWEWLVNRSTIVGETVLDPFMGSGTTGMAAKKLGRHFLGFEISAEYCQIARDRIARVEAQPNLFEKKPEQLEAFA